MDIDSLSRKLQTDLGKMLQKAVLAGAEELCDHAREIVPVKTGKLKGSISVGNPITNPKKLDTSVNFGAHTDYASSVEYGENGKRAKPYFRPAIDKGVHSGQTLKTMGKAMKTELKHKYGPATVTDTPAAKPDVAF